MSEGRRPNDATSRGWLRDALRRQYGAALTMLRSAVEACPEATWDDAPEGAGASRPAPWQLAYHALFFTHLYLMPDESAFAPWPRHHAGSQNPDGLAGPPIAGDPRPLLPPPYPREAVIAYLAWIEARLDGWLAELDLAAPDSGFSWYPVAKLDHQLVNLRHLQHHAAQLMQRVRDAGVTPGGWVPADPMPPR